nr:MAG TPA: hypothetical protein [Caudoviricetes sp.]
MHKGLEIIMQECIGLLHSFCISTKPLNTNVNST